MENKRSIKVKVNVSLTDNQEVNNLQVYAYTRSGKFLTTEKLTKQQAVLEVPQQLKGQKVELILGPALEKGQSEPSAENLKRSGGYALSVRALDKMPTVNFTVPGRIFPKWCFCLVKGLLVKRVILPNGDLVEQPVCNARVHICEVDSWPIFIRKLPELELLKLRDDLLKRIRDIEWPPRPPIPEPDPVPDLFEPPTPQPSLTEVRSPAMHHAKQLKPQLARLASSATQSLALNNLATTQNIRQIQNHLIQLADIAQLLLCQLKYLWRFYRKDCLRTVEVDENGAFNTLIFHDCNDQPDIYIWVEQFIDGGWQTVYKPSVACSTYWNYTCGDELVINVPNAEACDEPSYDIPDGVTLFVLPYAIGHTSIYGKPSGGVPAPNGWVRPDGKVNYSVGGTLGLLYDAPFARTLRFIQDDSYFIPNNGIKYYRYSFRRQGTSNWTPINTPLFRSYRMEYSDRLPTYEAYPIGPNTVGGETSLFEFKPATPPAKPGDPPTVEAREWTRGNLGEAAAVWDTTVAAPAMSVTNTDDDAGVFEIRVEVFDKDGNKVAPGAGTFQFLLRNTDGTSTRLAEAGEIQDDSYVFCVHVDNNAVSSSLPQPSIDGISASDDCGFLRYETGDQVRMQYHASHPNDHAVFRYTVKRGSNVLSAATTTAPYVETGAAVANTPTTPYVKVAGDYQRDFTVNELVGTCVNAAFALNLNVWGKATDGYHNVGIHSGRLIAFALAEQPEETP